ncbi:MAG: hypothetical protein FJX42_10555 [Alphaproteobacteria bacterium]|nr:hypothetical protein [Alphaproteobacteria bacterium]
MTGFATLFALIAFLFMAATVTVLAAGVSTLAASDAFRAKYANMLMRLRVGFFQAMAVVMLAFSMMAMGTA